MVGNPDARTDAWADGPANAHHSYVIHINVRAHEKTNGPISAVAFLTQTSTNYYFLSRWVMKLSYEDGKDT